MFHLRDVKSWIWSQARWWNEDLDYMSLLLFSVWHLPGSWAGAAGLCIQWGRVYLSGPHRSSALCHESAPLGRARSSLQHCQWLCLVGRQWRSLPNLYWRLLEVEVGTLYKYRGTSPSSVFLKSLHIMGARVLLNLSLKEKPSLHLYLAVYFSSSSMSLNVSSPQSQISFIKISTAQKAKLSKDSMTSYRQAQA